jgi:hypothetical protein
LLKAMPRVMGSLTITGIIGNIPNSDNLR